jgi:hypothetical protein
MKIYIDADGCPVVKLTIELAKKNSLPAVVVKNYAHVVDSDYAEVVTVDISRDSADYYIVNRLQPGDILVTQDYGLAAMALSKKAAILNQNGLIITDFNIMGLLDRRHVNQKMRKENRVYTKIPKRTREDDERYIEALSHLIRIGKDNL